MSLLSRYKTTRSSISMFHPKELQRSSIQRVFISSKLAILPPLEDSNPTTNTSKIPLSSTKNEEPVSDANIPSNNFFSDKKSLLKHVNLILNIPPQLPEIGNSSFSEIFLKRIDICLSMCDFRCIEFDVEAKKIKTDILTDFINNLKNPIFFISISLIEKELFFKLIELHIFREEPDVLDKYLFSDDLVVITEPSIPHLSLVFQILELIFISEPTFEKFNLNFIFKIISRFYTPDLTERNLLISFIIKWLEFNINYNDLIIIRLSSLLHQYLSKEVSPHILYPVLSLFLHFFSKNLEKYTNYYLNSILPSLGSPHLSLCQPQIQQIIELFINSNQNLVIPSIKAFIYHWPKTRSNKLVFFLHETTFLLTKIKPRDFKDIRIPIFKLYSKAAVSPHYKVAEAAYSIWTKLPLEPMIMDSARYIFPLIYSSISKGLKTHWNPNVIDILNSTMESMNRIDSFLFQELCRQKGEIKTEEKDLVRIWATVSRSAAIFDKNLNLASKLAEIQKTFVKQNNIIPSNNNNILLMGSQSTKRVIQPVVQSSKRNRF